MAHRLSIRSALIKTLQKDLAITVLSRKWGEPADDDKDRKNGGKVSVLMLGKRRMVNSVILW